MNSGIVLVDVAVRDLSGAALDWAVAKAASVQVFDMSADWPGNHAVTEATRVTPAVIVDLMGKLHFEASLRTVPWAPSTDWSQCGPLIDKYNPEENGTHTGERYAEVWVKVDGGGSVMGWGTGETRLIAACRAIVAATLGDIVKVPACLVMP